MKRALAVVLALAWLGAASPARGDDLADAKARFRRGVDLYKEKRWKDAMDAFEAAYRLRPHGALHYNVAQCRERLEDWPGALRGYRSYLREVPDASDRDAVLASMKRLEERLAAARVQVLLLDSAPAGARVTVEGLERGRTPLHVVLQPGSYAVELALQGHETWAERIEVGATASALVDVKLTPAPPPPELSARPAPAAAEDAASAPVRVAAPAARRARYVPAWVAAGTAVVAAVAGVAFGASARADERDIDALPAPDRAAALRKASSARSKARAANVLYGVAGGAAAAGATLLVLEARF